MFIRLFISVLLVGLCVGCSQPTGPDATIKTKDEAKDKPQQKQPETPSFTHVIATETEYYTTGPQQSRPPDGTFKAGIKVTLLEQAGSYSLVRAEDDIQAYVAADTLKPVDQPTSANDENTKAVVTGNNDFALNLYTQLCGKEGNLFFSPNSISTALAMTYAGAKGSTESEMATVLRFDLPQDQLHPAFAALNNTLNPKDKPYELSVANRLWGQQGYEFLPAFLQTTRDYYAAELAQVDFATAPEAVCQEINSWVEERTNNKIKDLMPENVLDEMTRLVLTNAIYFKGNWASQFDEEATSDAPFSVSSENKVTVPTMYQKGNFKYGEVGAMQVLELPYKSGDLSMLVLLPKAVDGLPALEAKLTTENLNKWTFDLSKREIDVYLPKFKMTSQFRLIDVLSSMGMPSAFDPMVADFSGMNGKTDLYISAVIHKAFVDVNEEGTEAAAATAVVVKEESVEITPTFRADHPFIFLIRDNRTGSILFIGRVTNPDA